MSFLTIAPFPLQGNTLAEWLADTRTNRIARLAKTLRAYRSERVDLSGLDWQSKRLALMRAELLALLREDMENANDYARMRGAHEGEFTRGFSHLREVPRNDRAQDIAEDREEERREEESAARVCA